MNDIEAPPPFDPAIEPYVSLATFRRNGKAVLTPVWLARHGDRFYLFSESRAGKVKRIRANPAVRLAACTATGKVTSGWLEGEARVITDARLIEAALLELRRKYGWQMIVTTFFSRLFGRYRNRAYIEVDVRGVRPA